MKKQYIKEGIAWIAEILLFPCAITYISKFLRPFSDCLDIAMRYLEFLVIYKAICYFFNKNMLDAKKDSLLSAINMFAYANLYYETKNEVIKNNLIKDIGNIEFKKYFFVDDTYSKLLELKSFLECNKQANVWVKAQLIDMHHAYENQNLSWNYTMLVRLLK